MPQAELAAWIESRDAHWCSQSQSLYQVAAPDEESSEIVAQFLAAPYPYQNQEEQKHHHEVGVVGAGATVTSYWPEPRHATGPGAAGTWPYFDLADEPKRKVILRDGGEDLGGHKKNNKRDKKDASKTAAKCGQESSQQSRGSCCCSDDDSNCSDVNRRKGKKARAPKGLVTDPQSLYARRRRERISERLKILQKLVPNGTKVDISTMLKEAVHYVRFLQQQIKMLSSDETWMYAPIAYNGMSLGIDLTIPPQ